MKKGITPVIAMILLILIVVALGGVFAAWTMRTFKSVQGSGEEQIEQISGQLQKSVVIDNVNCEKNLIYIKNTGSVNVTKSELGVYINDTLLSSFDATPEEVAPNQIMTINTTPTNLTGGTIKISLGAGIQDSTDQCA
ncbi:MAG: hypothetical protein J7L45_01275 [Candidatus Aenigmarchaeota archaeon]|nr:hypothetical protein [Candidatus Aenigmarchaeota archaeon]